MTKNNNFYPQPKDELVKIAGHVFTPVKNRLCITCFFVSGTGKRTIVKFILQDKEILGQIFGEELKKTLFIYIDPDEILNGFNENYLQLMLDKLILTMDEHKIKAVSIKTTNPLLGIKGNLERLISRDWHVVFLLNDFEFTLNLHPSIYRNLESILSMDKRNVTYVFLTSMNILDEETLVKFHNFKFAVNRVVYYNRILDEKTAESLLDGFAKNLKITINDALKKVLYELCGGHVQLLKYAINILKEAGDQYLSSPQKAKEYLLEYNQLKSVCGDVWNFLNSHEREILINIAKNSKIPASLLAKSHFIINTGLVKSNDKNSYHFFGKLFDLYVKSHVAQEKLTYDPKTKQIFYGLEYCGDKFTSQEFKLLIHFIQNEGKIISRDEVGEILWGSNYVEHYSDYSIDKIISMLRKKLDELGYPSNQIVTLKRRGFSFTNP